MYRDHEKRRGLWLLPLIAGRAGVRQPFLHRIERCEKVSELVRAVYESREKALSGGDLASIAPIPERYRHSVRAVVVCLHRRDWCVVALGIRLATAGPHSGVPCAHGSTACKSGQARVWLHCCRSHTVDDIRCIRRSSFAPFLVNLAAVVHAVGGLIGIIVSNDVHRVGPIGSAANLSCTRTQSSSLKLGAFSVPAATCANGLGRLPFRQRGNCLGPYQR